MLFVGWIVFHVLTCVALVLVVLMQSAKGEGLAGGTAFGGGVSGAVFGGRGTASFLSRATTVLAILFMINCGALAFMSSERRVITTAPGSQEAPAETSPITTKAQAERDAALERQAQQRDAAHQDSLMQAGDSLMNVDVVPHTEPNSDQPDMGGGSEGSGE